VHPDDADTLRAAFARALRDPRPTPPALVRFGGVPDVWRVLAITLTDMRHVPAVRGIVANSRDVTEQLELQERLRRAQKMEALGQLAGGVAHDFNNVLAAIAGYAQLIADALPDGMPRDDATEVLRAAERGAGVVRHLLAFSRRQALDVETLDLAAVVRESARMLRPLLPATVHLALPGDDAVVWVRASRTALEQIVVNLAVNARDAMPDGGTLTLAVHERIDAEGRRCGMLVVRDTGIGIPSEHRERVFEPFFTTKSVGRGTGLGLSTVYGLVRQLGGSIDLESAVRAGTTFTVSLPGATNPAIARPAAARDASAGDGRGRRVLLVEDEPAIREFARRVLHRAGYDVTTAAHGGEALARLERGDPVDVLLTDAAMPVLGGRALADAARALRPELPIVLMSGYDERMGIDEVGPISAFVEKPFQVAHLLAVLRQVAPV
jgi:two-component system cell cycle sensor histidine kinase/response regulator CckA